MDKSEEDLPQAPSARAVRIRVGRGGRILLDCRNSTPRRIVHKLPRSSLFGVGEEAKEEDIEMDLESAEDQEEADRSRRLEERWKYDSDDVPPVGPQGADEQDRTLVDNYNPT